MNRSGSQKILLVVSIIEIVFGAITAIGALMSVIGAAGVGLMGAAPNELADAGVTVEEASVAGGALALLGFVALISAAILLIEGILGVRAANDNQKIMPVWILAIISLAFAVIGLISAIVQHGSIISSIISLIIQGLMFYVVNNVKVEAGK